MSRRARWLLALCLTGLGAGSCGSDKPPAVVLEAEGFWNGDPSTVDQIGFQVWADVGWPTRPQSCFALSPNLDIRVNGGETPVMVEGDCGFDVLVMTGAFQQDVPITIALQDGDQVLAQAQFEHLFPGANTQLVTPAAGQQIEAGDPVVFTVPVQVDDATDVSAEFYWLDPPPTGVPPFHTFSPGTLSADGSTFQTTAPAGLTGHAAVVLRTAFNVNLAAALSCTGFEDCAELSESETVGPVFVEVVP
jgi:hypothetical protein